MMPDSPPGRLITLQILPPWPRFKIFARFPDLGETTMECPGFCLVAGGAEGTKVACLVCPALGQWDDVVHFPAILTPAVAATLGSAHDAYALVADPY